jgi:hypothetical protein
VKKEVAIGLIVTVVGGVLVYWFTQGIQEERKLAREEQQRIEQTREDQARQAREEQEAAAKAADAEARRPRMSAPEPNINRQGSDYKDFVATDFEACIRACELETLCKAITFTKSSRQCWMKSAVPFRSDDPSYTSAVKVGA